MEAQAPQFDVERVNPDAQFEVEDDGAGLTGQGIREGIGLTNTRERLRATFGDDFTFALEPSSNGGTIARASVPLRRTTP